VVLALPSPVYMRASGEMIKWSPGIISCCRGVDVLRCVCEVTEFCVTLLMHSCIVCIRVLKQLCFNEESVVKS